MNLFDDKKLAWPKACLLIAIASGSYSIAAIGTHFIGLIPVYFLSLLFFTKVEKYRHAFYLAWISSLITFALHISFFLNIFGKGSVFLWIILSFWPAIFVLLSKFILEKSNKVVQLITIPALFFVLEIISSELYPLRFSWGNISYMAHQNPALYGIGVFGIYGFSLLVFTLTILCENSDKRKVFIPGLMVLLTALSFINPKMETTHKGPIVTGIQYEFPEQAQALKGLKEALQRVPKTDIFMLSEYTFKDGIPQEIKNWCRENKVYLLAGTTFKTEDGANFYNTAAIVNPEGKIEFKQAKAQPIQFFNDGLPAPQQKLWSSPWGNIGLCICYDLSYGKVIDKLVDLGAQALLVPTMDVESWGEKEHKLHERVAPLRAVEYGIPVFKTASSGISQSVNSKGQVLASAPFPGQGEILSSHLQIQKAGSKPVDRYLFWPALFIIFWGFFNSVKHNRQKNNSTL